jgi:SAM-dependent methyltransferase
VEKYSEEYWNSQYLQETTGWDIGYVAPPLKDYFDQLTDKNIRILVPGGGNAYEVEYLFKNGFHDTFLLDISSVSIQKFIERCPDFPVGNIINQDFFQHSGTYDLVVEQTFLSSFLPAKRGQYVSKMSSLLKINGKLVALLFNHLFPFEGPPFGGTEAEYKKMFVDNFDTVHFIDSYNSIKPRSGREFFILLRKKI